MKKILPLIVLVLLVLVLGAVMNDKKAPSRDISKDTAPLETKKTYASAKYGLTFEYPAYYYLEEKDIDLDHRLHHEIILTEDTEENRAIREGKAVNGEGPVAITIDVFQNNIDKQSSEQFIKNTSESNYKLGNGNLSSTTKGTIMGLQYDWSGLYEGRSLVVSKPDYIYMFSATRLNPDDRIMADFEGILQTAVIGK